MRKEMKQNFDWAMIQIEKLNPELAAGMELTEWNPAGPGEKEWTRYRLERYGSKISYNQNYQQMLGTLDTITNLLSTNRYMVNEKIARDFSGYSNYATLKAAHILANWSTHHEATTEAVNLIMEQDTEDTPIEKIMSWVKGYFTEIADWHTAQSYEMPGSSGKECADFKGAVSEMCNVGIGQINWRELAEHLYQGWLENQIEEETDDSKQEEMLVR